MKRCNDRVKLRVFRKVLVVPDIVGPVEFLAAVGVVDVTPVFGDEGVVAFEKGGDRGFVAGGYRMFQQPEEALSVESWFLWQTSQLDDRRVEINQVDRRVDAYAGLRYARCHDD